jgi:nucleotide-binding universal stress UspA family protein
MEVRSILVLVGLGSQHAAVAYAAKLAESYSAEVIGLAAAAPNLGYVGVDGAQAAIDFYAMERENIERLLGQAEERFRSAVPAPVTVKWRSYVANVTEMLVDQARRCDLVVAATGDANEAIEGLDVGHLILSCGRPVIMVGDGSKTARTERILIAWKDTREARRAVSDALPLLQHAKEVKVVTRSEGDLASEAASLNDIVEWLARHGVTADRQLVERGVEFLDAIGVLTLGDSPDLIVAGGYGHSRVREWLFGGVTNDLLNAKSVNRLFSN